MRTDRVEVPEQDYIPVRIRLLHIDQNLLQHAFCLSVRIGDLPFGAFLRNRNKGRIAVYRGGRRKDNIFHAMPAHHIHEHKRAADIIVIILPRLGHRFAHRFQSCEMDAAVYGLLRKHLFQTFPVQNIHLIKRYRLSRDLLHTLQRFLTGIAQVIHYDHIVARFL